MLEKMVIVVIAFFIFMTYNQHLLVCAWTALILNIIFVLHEVYYVMKNHSAGKHISNLQQFDESSHHNNPGKFFEKMEGGGGFNKLKDSLKLHHDYWWPQKDRKRRMAKIIKLGRDFLLVTIYMTWILAILNLIVWQEAKCTKNTAKCRKINKNAGINLGALFTTEIGVENFIYFLPMLISCCWKSYVIVESKRSVDDEILVIQELIDLQCKSEIFIAVYFFIDKFTRYAYNLFLTFSGQRTSPNDSIKTLGYGILILAYLGIKYGWSLGMRISFWKTHLLMDYLVKFLGNKARAFYHYFIYGWVSKLAQKPLKHKYQRRYGLYFDLL